MTYNDIVFHALRTADRPLASHQLFELPACEGLTRQQVSSAVGHLRRAGKIKETLGTVPGPLHGPKRVRQYEVTPQEEGLDEALIDALAASTEAAPTPTAAAQAEQSRLEATRPQREERAIPRTGQPAKPGRWHPFMQPISPDAPANRHGRITRDLPGHLVSTDARMAAEARAISSYTPKWDRLDPDEVSQEADYLAAVAEAEEEATATAEVETMADLSNIGDDALLTHTALDADLARDLAAPTLPSDDTTKTDSDSHQCCGKCQGHDQSNPANTLPSWVADLQAWLGPLPIGMTPNKLVARFSNRIPGGDLRIRAVDDGCGAFAILSAQSLGLNAGEMARIARYTDAILWIFDAMAGNFISTSFPSEVAMNDLDEHDGPIPEWAVKKSEGNYLEIGAQLRTRDGRRTGNAYIDDVIQHESRGTLGIVITDMGNVFRMTADELEELFYPPIYVMDLDEARARRVKPDANNTPAGPMPW